MGYNLKDLIKAAGGAGIGGQSFLSNVTGAGQGTKMTDYVISGWSFSGTPSSGVTYPDGQVFNESVTFTRGAKAQDIQIGGDVVTVQNVSVGLGANVAIASNIDVAAGTGSVTLTLTAPVSNAGTPGGSAAYQGTVPASGSGDPAMAKFTLTLTGTTASGTGTMNWRITYNPDSGPFNPEMYDDQSCTINLRQQTLSDYESQWFAETNYNANGYNGTPDHTGNTFSETTYEGQTYTYYLRTRLIGSTTWTNVGAVSFTDNGRV